MACSEGKIEESVSKACRKGLSGRWLPGQVALSEGRSGRVFGGSFEGGIRQGFGKASKRGRGLSGTRVRLRRGSERPSGLACLKRGFRREFRRGVFERFHGGRLRSLDPRSTA